MILVADTSALIALSVCDSLQLLDDIFANVVVPEEVFTDAIKSNKSEAQSINNYLQDKLLIDDKRGRKIAKLNNISIIGSLGVLIHAKQLGLIQEVKPRIQKIINSAIYLDSSLIASVLEISGENHAD